jgi:hypothetical protein
MKLNADFTDLLTHFSDHQVEFALIGGWALAVYGYARGTDDLDVLVRATPENAERVMRALAAFGAPIAQHHVTASLFATPDYGYRMGVKPNLIEILTTISGVTFDDVMKEHRTVDVEGRKVAVIGRGALLTNKRASGRAKDLADVEWLEAHPAEEPDR